MKNNHRLRLGTHRLKPTRPMFLMSIFFPFIAQGCHLTHTDCVTTPKVSLLMVKLQKTRRAYGSEAEKRSLMLNSLSTTSAEISHFRMLCEWFYFFSRVLILVFFVWSSLIYILARACWWGPSKADTGSRMLSFARYYNCIIINWQPFFGSSFNRAFTTTNRLSSSIDWPSLKRLMDSEEKKWA